MSVESLRGAETQYRLSREYDGQVSPFHRPYPGEPGSNQFKCATFIRLWRINMENKGEDKLLVKQKKQVWWKGPV